LRHATDKLDALNYFIFNDENGKVTGIDNDQCFGKNRKDPNGIAYKPTDQSEGFRGTEMPPAMDQDKANAFNGMKPEDLETLLTRLAGGRCRCAATRERFRILRTTSRP
jgi:hypothetical protein